MKAVRIQSNSSGSLSSVEEAPEDDKLRRRFFTSHRQNLDRIQKDTASGNPTRHSVHYAGNDDNFSASAYGGPEQWLDRHRRNLKQAFSGRSCQDWAEAIIPMASWLKTYDWRNTLLSDMIAGLTVGVMIVPQSMSYAKLAGLPVEYGLYSAIVPVYAYAFFGTSRQLAVGPVALISLLLNTGLTIVMENSGRTPDNTENYDEIYGTLAIQTSFLVGICYILMGVFRLGFITILLSHAVVSGFTSAAAIIIGMTQLKYVLGYSIPSDKSLHKMLHNIFKDIDKFNWRTFILGTTCVAFLLGLKQIVKKYPKFHYIRALGPLIVTVVTILLQITVDLEDKGIGLVGAIPKGLPRFSGAEAVAIEDIGQLAVVVISIVVVGFMESIAIAKQLAGKHNYEIDSSKELIGLGAANLCAGLFSGYPLTGSFSRSAVNNEAGAKSGISACVTATLVGIVVLFLTPVFELLSLPTLASIVISGVVSLVDFAEAIYLWRVHRFDFGVWMFAFVGTLFLGVELGLGIAVGLSLTLVIFESAYPHTAILGRLPGRTEYRNIKNYRQAECYDGILIVRIDAPIYFANTQNIREKVQKYERRVGEVEKVQFIIIEFSAVAHVDTSALHTLHEMHSNFKNRNIRLCITNPNAKVMERLQSSGFVDELGRDQIFVSTHDAVQFCLKEMDIHEIKHSSHPVDNFPLKVDPEYQDLTASGPTNTGSEQSQKLENEES
jgi:sulfate transporter 4